MPAGDRTGPRGVGPMTGRGLGYCGGYGAPGYANQVGRGGWGGRGRGFGGRGGGGRGWRNMYYATGLPGWARYGYPVPPAPEQELTMLKEQADYLKDQLGAISKRIDEIEQEE